MLIDTLVGALLALITALPLASKWGLGVRRTAVAIALLAMLSGLIVAYLASLLPLDDPLRTGLVWFLTLGLALAILAYRFYRDPERNVPDRDDVILSPADGKVIYVNRSADGTLPVMSKLGRNYRLEELTKTRLEHQEAVVVGISLSFLDVHVNRSPYAGRVTLLRHFPGQFGSLRRPEMAFENERVCAPTSR